MDLSRQRPRDTYRYLLQVPGDPDSVAGVTLETGDGTPLPIAIGTGGVWFTGLVDMTAATLVRGDADTYMHTQSVPAAVWTIAHGLGRHPSVTVTDSAGTVCVGDVRYADINTVIVTFSAAFAGVAHLS